MRNFSFVLSIALLTLWANPAFAETQKTNLALENMTCSSCPYMVKGALTQVDGVTDVKVSYEKKTAYITFENTKTTIAALVEATTNAGFPSHEITQKKGSSK